MNELNIMIVGVGGQGTLLASKILGAIALKCGFDVKVSEVHGMSQRGGSVVTYVRMGQCIHSPLVGAGEADIMLAFEQLEAMRWAKHLKKDGRFIINEQMINPIPVITGNAKYPDNIIPRIKAAFKNTVTIDALKVAKECGSIKAANTVMIGIMAKTTDIAKEYWTKAIKENVPAKLLDVNLKAFEAGYSY